MRVYGGIPVGGNLAGTQPPDDAVKFDPRQLNVQPMPGYNLRPGYNPTTGPMQRDRFILFDPRSGVAGNPFGSDFVIPQNRQPQAPGPQLNPLQQTPVRIFPQDQPGREGAIDVRFRQAMNIPGAPGNFAGVANAQFFGGPQYGQMPVGFQNKTVA